MDRDLEPHLESVQCSPSECLDLQNPYCLHIVIFRSVEYVILNVIVEERKQAANFDKRIGHRQQCQGAELHDFAHSKQPGSERADDPG